MTAVMKAEPHKVNGDTGQIIEEHPTTEEIVVKVKDYLEAQEKKVFFNGKRYPQYADWQYVGGFYGITVKTFDAHFLEMGGRKGFSAKAMLLRDQQEIGRAEAFCMDDEPNWRNKPLFQLASMAQTRAAAKAYSNLFRAIVGLAGIETTPAEEMSEDAATIKPKELSERTKELGQRLMHKPIAVEPEEPSAEEIEAGEEIMSEEVAAAPIPDHSGVPPGGFKDEIPFGDPAVTDTMVKKVSKKQASLLWVKCKNAAIPEVMRNAWMRDHYGISNFENLPWQAMDPFLKWIEAYQGLKK